MSSAVLNIFDIQNYVTQVAKLYDVKKVSLFGSYANGSQTPQSDIDLLVEFNNPDLVTLITIAGIKIKLEELTHKAVDVIYSPIPEGSILEIKKEMTIYG